MSQSPCPISLSGMAFLEGQPLAAGKLKRKRMVGTSAATRPQVAPAPNEAGHSARARAWCVRQHGACDSLARPYANACSTPAMLMVAVRANRQGIHRDQPECPSACPSAPAPTISNLKKSSLATREDILPGTFKNRSHNGRVVYQRCRTPKAQAFLEFASFGNTSVPGFLSGQRSNPRCN